MKRVRLAGQPVIRRCTVERGPISRYIALLFSLLHIHPGLFIKPRYAHNRIYIQSPTWSDVNRPFPANPFKSHKDSLPAPM